MSAEVWMPDDSLDEFEDEPASPSERTAIGPAPRGPPQANAAAPARPRPPLRPDAGSSSGPRAAPGARPESNSGLRPVPAQGVAPQRPAAPRPAAAAPRPAAPGQRRATFFPPGPKTLAETGLSGTYLEDLCMKHIFQAGELRGNDLSSRVALPSVIVEETLERLRRNKMIDIKGSGGAGLGRSSMIFILTEQGQNMVRLSMERDRYVGPAPVRFDRYCEAVAAQSIRGNSLRREDLEPFFTDLVVKDEVYDAIGPAMNSGKALFFYGAPGNGKTAVCSRMTNCFGGDVFIPFALIVDDFVVKVFDDTVHIPIERQEGEQPYDQRWIRCKRPMVVVGGELTLDQLDLSYSTEVKYYEAPFQLKANCGMLLVDDFGRQKVSPKDLLNRWIVPLESEFDFLTLHTGKKLKVPFDVFVTFSTNLDPGDLVDAAFLRRVRYKLEVNRPDEEQFRRIFLGECKKKKVRFDEGMLDYLIEKHYAAEERPFNACEPRDLLGQVVDLCAYLGIESQMTHDILDRVVASYFVRFDKKPA